MNEAETRAEHIDPALKAAGWGVVEGSRILREYPIAPGRIEGHGRRSQSLKADYILEYRNRKLAVSLQMRTPRPPSLPRVRKAALPLSERAVRNLRKSPL